MVAGFCTARGGPSVDGCRRRSAGSALSAGERHVRRAPAPSRPGRRALRGVPGSRAWAACDEQGRRAFPAPPAPRPFAVVTKTRSSLPR